MEKTDKKPKSQLPVYKMKLMEDTDESTGLSQISLVAEPAIDILFLTFNKGQAKPNVLKLSVSNPDEQICMGPVMVPNLPVYRNEQGFEYILLATEQDILNSVLKYSKQKRNNNVDLSHDGSLVSGVTMLDSFITNEKRGILPPTGFSDLPWGTWFVSYKVDNPEIWASIKAGEFSGFSITGLYDLEKTDIDLDVSQDQLLDPQGIYDEFIDLLDSIQD